jgi:hypothetical protein
MASSDISGPVFLVGLLLAFVGWAAWCWYDSRPRWRMIYDVRSRRLQKRFVEAPVPMHSLLDFPEGGGSL